MRGRIVMGVKTDLRTFIPLSGLSLRLRFLITVLIWKYLFFPPEVPRLVDLPHKPRLLMFCVVWDGS